MKRQLEYDGLKELADHVAKQIRLNYETALAEKRVYLFAVARGGLTFGHLVSTKLKMQLGVVFPLPEEGVSITHPSTPDDVEGAVFIYLEDVIAEGRTFNQVMGWHARIFSDYVRAEFVPVVIDANVSENIRNRVNIFGMMTSDWIVFPHEEQEQVVEGDRGLFRTGTSENSK